MSKYKIKIYLSGGQIIELIISQNAYDLVEMILNFEKQDGEFIEIDGIRSLRIKKNNIIAVNCETTY